MRRRPVQRTHDEEVRPIRGRLRRLRRVVRGVADPRFCAQEGPRRRDGQRAAAELHAVHAAGERDIHAVVDQHFCPRRVRGEPEVARELEQLGARQAVAPQM